MRVAIQYPSFGPQHPPRLQAIVDACPYENAEVIALEMFARDSDYEWDIVPRESGTIYRRHTVFDGSSIEGRNAGARLRDAVNFALSDIAPDAIIVNGWGHKESRITMEWCRRTKCRMILLNDSVYENRRRFWPLELYKRWLVRGVEAGFVAGSPQARYLERLGIPFEKSFFPGSCVVDNTYWRNESDKVRENAADYRQNFNLPDRFFFCCSRFLDWKNIPFVIEAYADYFSGCPDDAAHLVICGDGPEKNKILNTIDRLGLTTVHLKGFRQIDELPAYYALAEAFVHASSSFECWGLVVNEAMACGIPVIISSAVGSAEDLVVGGVNGYTFDPRNKDDLVSHLNAISNGSGIKERMGRASREIIAKHSPEDGAISFWGAVAAILD